MLSSAITTGFVLLAIAATFVTSYTIGNAQDYSSPSYNPSSFISLKEPQSVVSTNYATSISPRYSPVYSPSSSHPEVSQSSGYVGHSSVNAPEVLNTLTASYQSDSGSDHASYSSPQNIDYVSSGHSPSSGSVSFSGYSGSQGSNQDLGVEYASPSTASSSYSSSPLSGYSVAKAAAYSSSVNHPSSQHGTSYPSSSNVNYASHSPSTSAGHASYPAHSGSFIGGKQPGSSYAGESAQSSFSDGHRLSPSALKSFMSSLHRESPGSYHSSGPSHSSNYIHPALASASYSKSPGPFFSGGFPKGAGKIIIIKDGSGTHALMHPESSYPSGMFSGGSGYKVRSAGPFSSGHHYGSPSSSYSHSPGYSGTSGHPNTAGSGTSYFGYS
ncbi:uncharacterized protein LOC135172808 [Diachasmimorpha longicaudata]|uniref:uncharacterized protein LOC135172808 n=1 Tax=Diachasmimorpha longicaudata TaxID=58733 RepID=UPI0030B8B871